MGLTYSAENPEKDLVRNYCKSVVFVKFYGQTNSTKGSTDETEVGECHSELGCLLKELDAEIRTAASPSEFEITENFKTILRKIAELRCDQDHNESADQCYERMLKDAENFKKLYHTRNRLSEVLHNDIYWGTRQQLLFGKVVADWIDRCDKKAPELPPSDPIFGVLLNPTGGRVGPGDTTWFHNTLFDDYGHMAYHSAVHDGFGYLKTAHATGPGYDYLDEGWLSDGNPMAGQICGISFWRDYLKEICPEQHLEKFCCK